MQIQKDTWHYRVWCFTHPFHSGTKGKKIPHHTNLCRYVSRIILFPIPVFTFWAGVCVCGFGALLIGNTMTILSGTGWFWLDDTKNEKGEVDPIKRFAPIKLARCTIPVRPVVLSSYVLLATGLIAYFNRASILSYTSTQMFDNSLYIIAGIISLLILYFLGMTIADGWRSARRWDGWRLFKEYLKSKKQGICPVVTFN